MIDPGAKDYFTTDYQKYGRLLKLGFTPPSAPNKKIRRGRAKSKRGINRERRLPFSKCKGLEGSGGPPSECTRSNRLS